MSTLARGKMALPSFRMSLFNVPIEWVLFYKIPIHWNLGFWVMGHPLDSVDSSPYSRWGGQWVIHDPSSLQGPQAKGPSIRWHPLRGGHQLGMIDRWEMGLGHSCSFSFMIFVFLSFWLRFFADMDPSNVKKLKRATTKTSKAKGTSGRPKKIHMISHLSFSRNHSWGRGSGSYYALRESYSCRSGMPTNTDS